MLIVTIFTVFATQYDILRRMFREPEEFAMWKTQLQETWARALLLAWIAFSLLLMPLAGLVLLASVLFDIVVVVGMSIYVEYYGKHQNHHSPPPGFLPLDFVLLMLFTRFFVGALILATAVQLCSAVVWLLVMGCFYVVYTISVDWMLLFLPQDSFL